MVKKISGILCIQIAFLFFACDNGLSSVESEIDE